MTEWTVEINGTPIKSLFDIDYDAGSDGKIGGATIICGNNSTNKEFGSGDSVEIWENNEKRFSGYVMGKPSKAGSRSVELEIECYDKRIELRNEQVKRPFYQRDTGEIIRRVVNYRADKLEETVLTRGDNMNTGSGTGDLRNWNGDFDVIELGRIPSQTLYERGNDFVFCGLRENIGRFVSEDKADPYFTATYSGISPSDLPNDDPDVSAPAGFEKLETRFALHAQGDLFKMEVHLRDHYTPEYNENSPWYDPVSGEMQTGRDYFWEIDLSQSSNGFSTHELRTEEAKPTSSLNDRADRQIWSRENGVLEYAIELQGSLPEPRALGIDYALVVPFRENSRRATDTSDGTELDPSGVQNTDRFITRRFDRDIFQLIDDLSTEDGYFAYADSSDVLHYVPRGTNSSPKRINYDTQDGHSPTRVIDATFNRDFDTITNRVVVQGAEGIRVPVEDSDSIDYYGICPREQPIIDRGIQTESEARDRANGYLDSHAWDEVAFEFDIADKSYQRVRIGDRMIVDWPSENISGYYTVSKKETNRNGIVTLGLTKRL